MCVKANEAGLAARAARVRSKARGAAAGPSKPKRGSGEQMDRSKVLLGLVTVACGVVVVAVHKQQTFERSEMHKGVLRDMARQEAKLAKQGVAATDSKS